ncbi:MAG TPA: hypothetical protein H9675_04745 [Firmicutes bacterium]|mgnify:FL=1|nr:hypothetical protein [Bacillota bacterium]
MPKNKLSLNFDGFAEILNKLEKLGKNSNDTAETALIESKHYVHKNLEDAMAAHNRTGQTERSLHYQDKIEWTGSIAEMGVGFDISGGGLPSIFLMYGTPRMSPDKKLYNAIFGNKTRKEISEIQSDIFRNYLRKVME